MGQGPYWVDFPQFAHCDASKATVACTVQARVPAERGLHGSKPASRPNVACTVQARIPAERGFAAKGELAHPGPADTGLAAVDCLGDCWQSLWQEWRFRYPLEQAQVGYMLAVPKSQQILRLLAVHVHRRL